MSVRLAALAALALIAGCAQPVAAPLPAKPVAAGPGIDVVTAPVPLYAKDPSDNKLGEFTYAGGLQLTSAETARLHGLSDIVVQADRLFAVSDEGDFFQARLVLAKDGRLTGLADARISALQDPDGKPLAGKAWGDAEGLAILPNGDRLVSFEQNHRILLYPADGAPPKPAASPQASFPANGGMEAMRWDPAGGPDAYIVGAEESRETWACKLAAGCKPLGEADLPEDFSLVAMSALPNGVSAHLGRAFDAIRGARMVLIASDGKDIQARLDLARPLVVDNFEGLAAVDRGEGVTRFYVISDDNFAAAQRTLLLAFDWTRPKPKPKAKN